MPKDGVLRYLDLLAAHKLNVFHFHLTDDQGWRVEIQRYPELTEVGAWRARTKFGHRASPLWDETPARRLLHPGRHPRDRRVRRRAAHHRRPRDRHPRPLAGRHRRLPGTGQHRRHRHRLPRRLGHLGHQPERTRPHRQHPALLRGRLRGSAGAVPRPRFIHIGGDECPKDQWKASPGRPGAHRASWGWRTRTSCRRWFIRHFDQLARRARPPADRLGRDPGGRRSAPATAPPSPPGAATRAASPPPGPATTSSCAPSSRCTWTTVRRRARTSRCPSATSAPWRTSTASSRCPRSSTAGRGRHVLGTQANVWTEVMEDRRARRLPGLPAARRLRRGRLVAPCPPPPSGTSRTSSGAWTAHYAAPGRPGRRATARPPARCPGSAAPACSDARSRGRPRTCEPAASVLAPRPAPGTVDVRTEQVVQGSPKSGNPHATGDVTRNRTIPQVQGRNCLLADPRVGGRAKMCQSCHVRAVSTYRTAAQAGQPGHREGAAGLTTHAPQAAQARDAAGLARRGRGGARRHARRRARRGRHRPDGRGQLRPAAARRARRPRPDQRDPRLAVPGRTRPARRRTHPRPDGPPRLRRPHPRAGRRRARRGPAADPQRGHPRRQHRHAPPPPATRCPCWPPWRPTLVIAGPERRAPRDPGQPSARRHGDAARPANSSASCACRCCTPRRPSSRPPAAPAPAAPSRPSPLVLDPARRGVRCAVGAVAPMPLRPLEAERGSPRSSTGTASAALAPEALHGLRRVRRRGLHPRPAPAAGRLRAAACRPPYCICGVRSPRWPDEHWGGRWRERRPAAARARTPGRRAGSRMPQGGSTTRTPTAFVQLRRQRAGARGRRLGPARRARHTATYRRR